MSALGQQTCHAPRAPATAASRGALAGSDLSLLLLPYLSNHEDLCPDHSMCRGREVKQFPRQPHNGQVQELSGVHSP